MDSNDWARRGSSFGAAAAMLAELRRQVPSARALPGPAEAIPLADGSVDAVLCGQSMHWFDMSRALPQIARVLVHGTGRARPAAGPGP